MELLSLLRRKQLTISNLNIKATGELTKQVPYHYIVIDVIFEVNCLKDLQLTVSEAIDEVMKSICGVSFMLQKIMPVNWKVDFMD
jgi:uncharacterized OsmC-like protein